MFTPDVITLRQFYATPLGEGTRALISESLQNFWPQAKGENILGIGFSTPYLEPYISEAASAIICMPAHQGAAYWPPSGNNCVFLAHESELPLPESSINRILLFHSVENSEQLAGMIKEMYRVLTPGGRMLAVVPNRLGLWARSSRSPFGYGRPFSMTQLRELMTEHELTVTRSSSALFIPPTHLRLVWRFARKIETIGKFLCPFVGGVLLVEAEKQLYASIKQPVTVRKGYPVGRTVSSPVLGFKSCKEK